MLYRSEVLADSPLVYYRVGEASGTAAADEQAAHNGTYVNTPTLGVAGGVVGDTAASFDSSQSERLASTTLGTLGQNILTAAWEFWIKTTTTGQGVVFGTFNTGSSLAIQVQLNRSAADAVAVGKTRVFVRGTNGSQTYGEIATNIYDGAWHHVKITMPTATTFQVRVDKVNATVTYALQQTIASTANFGFPMMFAARNLRGVIDNHATIALDEIAVYPSGLSDARSDAHYDARNTAMVSATRAVGYDIQAAVSGTRQLCYDLEAGVAGTRQVSYDIAAGAAPVSATRELRYDVEATATGQRQVRYDLEAGVSGTRTLAYNTLATVTGTRQVRYDLQNAVSGQRVIVYTSRAFVAAEKVVSYDIGAVVATPRLRALLGVGQ